jgi:hypothetical protein
MRREPNVGKLAELNEEIYLKLDMLIRAKNLMQKTSRPNKTCLRQATPTGVDLFLGGIRSEEIRPSQADTTILQT